MIVIKITRKNLNQNKKSYSILNRKDIKYKVFNGAEYYEKKYTGKILSPPRKRN